MNARGVAVVLLKYRVPRRAGGFDKNHQPLQDAQRALSILRTRAQEWGIHPKRIGIGGFSAGGHLAASLAINHAKRSYAAVDDSDKTSCRPDFAVLLYPAYLTDPIESRNRDKKLNYDLIDARATPPTLIGITEPDKCTIGAVELYLALMKAGTPAEMHVYAEGGHGGAIRKQPFGQWAEECHRFLKDQGILPGAVRPRPLTYRAKTLAARQPMAGLTIGDQRLRQVLGRARPVTPVWPKGKGPDETGAIRGPEVATARSRGGTALNIRNVSRPTLTWIAPRVARTGRAVIVCPGGGYNGLAAEHEGTRVCQWFNRQGVMAVLLKYRVPRREGQYLKHHHALQDLQRSIRIVRANARRWKIDPDNIGVCGFSAGGHLCAALCTNYDRDLYRRIDKTDDKSARPDFAVLIYPAYLTESRKSNTVDPLLLKLQRDTTPPLFMAAARNDSFTHGMLNFLLKVRDAEVPAECHVYSTGGHGGGIDPVSYPTSEWTRACERWLKDLSSSRKSDAAGE